MSKFAPTPQPPYYAVIFANQRGVSDATYAQTAARMVELAKDQPGYLGIESARGDDGFGITVSYWESEDAIRNWKFQTEHIVAQETGIKDWYEHYELRVAKVERAYSKQVQASSHAIVWGGEHV
jgi:heme-degrading monooxygenase HmoA